MLVPYRARGVLRAARTSAVSFRYNAATPKPSEPELAAVAVPSQSSSAALRSADDLLQDLTGKLNATSATAFWRELENIEIKPFDQIEGEINERMKARYSEPSKAWIALMQPKGKQGRKPALPGTILQRQFGSAHYTLRPRDLSKAVDVGDVVELRGDFHRPFLYVVAAIPSDPLDSRYTLISHTGQIHYTGRSAFQFRIPGFFPKAWLLNAVMKETLVEGYPAVGVSKDISNFVGNDFLQDMALTREGLATYLVPDAVRAALRGPLVECMHGAWSQLSTVSRKLEIIHRALQNTLGPTSVSLFTLCRALRATDLGRLRDRFGAAGSDPHRVEAVYDDFCRTLTEATGEAWLMGNTNILGKNYGVLDPEEPFDAVGMFALLLALRKQNRLWGDLNVVTGFSGPISVVALPLSKGVRLEAILTTLKLSPKMLALYVENLTTKTNPQAYAEAVYLLKAYVAGDITDASAETMVVKLLRSLPLSQGGDLSRSTAFALLKDLGEVQEGENPITWLAELVLPLTGISHKADLEQEYHDMYLPSTTFDPSGPLREDFRSLPVYCIDSATAHEIDDGLSVRPKEGTTWEVLVHIADPASYFRPESQVARIAFDRASTVYLPERVLPMLPKLISDAVGLGKDGTATRCLTYSFDIDLGKPGLVDPSSFRVRAGTVRCFPKATYADVDAILSGKQLAPPAMKRDLETMLAIAQRLRQQRVAQGAIVFGTSVEDVQMSLSAEAPKELCFTPRVETTSQVLVSELMIMANHISGTFFKKHEIPGVFRQFLLPKVDASITQMFSALSERCMGGDYPPLTEIAKVSGFMSASTYTTRNDARHEMLGVSSYNPSSSPLRRFGDMISHWQVHAYLQAAARREAPVYPFSQTEVNYMALHIQTRDQIIKRSVQRSTAYWVHTHLAALLALDANRTFEALVISSPVKGQVRATLMNFGISCRVHIAPEEKPPAIGDMLRGYRVRVLDVVEGRLVLEAVAPGP